MNIEVQETNKLISTGIKSFTSTGMYNCINVPVIAPINDPINPIKVACIKKINIVWLEEAPMHLRTAIEGIFWRT